MLTLLLMSVLAVLFGVRPLGDRYYVRRRAVFAEIARPVGAWLPSVPQFAFVS